MFCVKVLPVSRYDSNFTLLEGYFDTFLLIFSLIYILII